ncbi:unnamed protein product, partial [Timema podura]|nr:unnamed protein product [Timema podura]
EILFLAWGIKVCYNVRNAESLYDEARLISYAIYNIALVNTAMIAFHTNSPHASGLDTPNYLIIVIFITRNPGVRNIPILEHC